jgi:hypothetical protein
MRQSFVIAIWLLATACPLFGQTEKENASSCISCHLEIGDEMVVPVAGMKDDVHARQGLSCEDCHGGDPTVGFDGDAEASMNPEKGYIGVPARKNIPQFCARCHSDPDYMHRYNPRAATDQLSNYKTSVHGKQLALGDTKVATCIDCHGVHGIHEADDARSSVYALNLPKTCARCHADPEYMSSYGIPTDQAEEYSQSVHGVALLEKGDQAAPTCNDCHGNHGATPPGAPSIAFVCGQCHLNNSELFFESPHKAAFQELDLPECKTCHGSHDIQHPTDEMLGAGEGSICTDCHDEGSQGLITAIALKQRIDELEDKITEADSLLKTAERAGMQVTEATFQLKDAEDALIRSHTIVHSLSIEDMEEVAGEALKLSEAAHVAAIAALDELQFRRKGLAFSLVFILLLAGGLYFRIKEVDKKHPFRKYGSSE